MPEVVILHKGDTAPTGDFVFVTRRIAPNNSIVTDIVCMKGGQAVKTITERQFTPDVAIEKGAEVADAHEVDVVYMLDLS